MDQEKSLGFLFRRGGSTRSRESIGRLLLWAGEGAKATDPGQDDYGVGARIGVSSEVFLQGPATLIPYSAPELEVRGRRV